MRVLSLTLIFLLLSLAAHASVDLSHQQAYVAKLMVTSMKTRMGRVSKVTEVEGTGFVYDHNLIMTNSHNFFVFDDLNKKFVSADAKVACESISFRFTKGKKTKSYKCSNILVNEPKLDILIVEVDKDPLEFIEREPLEFAPVVPGKAYSLHYDESIKQFEIPESQMNSKGAVKIHYFSSIVDTRLSSEGRALSGRFGSVLEYTEETNKFIHGDSGSPIFSPEGQLIGIGWGSFKGTNKNAYMPLWIFLNVMNAFR